MKLGRRPKRADAGVDFEARALVLMAEAVAQGNLRHAFDLYRAGCSGVAGVGGAEAAVALARIYAEEIEREARALGEWSEERFRELDSTPPRAWSAKATTT